VLRLLGIPIDDADARWLVELGGKLMRKHRGSGD
jgi:hypothetical protein